MNENTLWMALTAVGVLGALVVGFGIRKLHGKIKEAWPEFLCPLLQFRYTAHDARSIAHTMEEKGLAQPYRRLIQLMLAMMAEVLLLLMAAAHNITDIAWLQQTMFALSGVIWLTGSMECLLLQKCPKPASLLAYAKWGAFALWTLGMFAGLFIRSTVY